MAVIIYPPAINWNWMRQRPQQLLKQFALDGNEAYFCNRTQKEGEIISEVIPNLYVVNNNKEFIRKIIPNLKKHQKIIVWVTWPKLYPFLHQYFPDLVVYDLVDDFPDWSPYVPEMMRKADLFFVTSSSLKEKMKQSFPDKKYHLVPNGCDIEHFQQYKKILPEKPKEYYNHNGPIIGYIGAWAPWIDKDILTNIANTFPKAMISIIGAEFRAKYDNSLLNVVYLGHKLYEDLPQYLYYCDVCIIPFKINTITRATNPIKMYEYLAAYKPVVTTEIPEAKNIPYVFIGRDKDSFIQHLKNIFDSKVSIDDAKLNSWITLQSWEKRYKDIKKIIEVYDQDFFTVRDKDVKRK